MAELAAAVPGFIDHKDLFAEDAENLTLVRFDSDEHLDARAKQEERRAGHERARQEFFSDYRTEVCRTERAYRFAVETGRRDIKAK